MKVVWNILLGIFSFLCFAVLLLQGFALPALAPWTLVLLRLGSTLFAQWLFFRAFRKNWLRILPLLLSSLVSVWGYFLYLTSPSWRNATLKHFYGDYAAFFFGCAIYLAMRWLLPRLLPRLKKGIVLLFTRRKRKKASKKDMPRFR